MYELINHTDTPVSIEGSNDHQVFQQVTQRKITRTSNGTIYVIYSDDFGDHKLYSENSLDYGTTWGRKKLITGALGSTHQFGAIAVDSWDNLHVVWQRNNNIYYSKYTNGTYTWSVPLKIDTHASSLSSYIPSLALDSNNAIHVVWYGAFVDENEHQVFYKNRTFGGSWSEVVHLVKMDSGGFHTVSTIEVDSDNNLHVAFSGTKGPVLPVADQIYYLKRADSTMTWSYPIIISNYTGMEAWTQHRISMTIDSDENIHIVWNGFTPVAPNNIQIWYVNHTSVWSYPRLLSTYAGMNGRDQFFPSIAIDSSDYLHVLWNGKATGFLGAEKIWYLNRTTAWSTPPNPVQTVGNNEDPGLRWSRWPDPGPGDYFITNINGTIIDNDCPDLDCAKDKIDIIMGYDPMDPDPLPWAGSPALLNRFAMRRYFLMVGWGMFWGPIWFFCYRRPSGYMIGAAFIFMLIGLGLLLQIPYI